MHTRRALVTGAGVAGLATTYRLLRSEWDVVLLTTATPARLDGVPAVLNDFGLDAARRLGLLPALTVGRNDVVAALNAALGDFACRRAAEVSALHTDDCGVTASFTNGDEDWFDLVVDARPTVSHVDGEPERVALVGNAAWRLGPHTVHGVSLAIGGAEMLGDALDIFPGTDEALSWWKRTLRPYVLRARAANRVPEDEEGTWASLSTRSVNWMPLSNI